MYVSKYSFTQIYLYFYKYSLFLSGMKENEGHTFREFSHCSKYSVIRHAGAEVTFNCILNVCG